MVPKTVKAYLKLCLDIAHTTRCELKGIDKLSEKEYLLLGDIRAAVQNELGENRELLEKYNLKYKS